jgi:hypothetical protein
MDKQQFIEWAKRRGWSEDKFDHLHKVLNGTSYRFKISSIAVRYEEQVEFSTGKHEWLRICSGYFKDLIINPENKLLGMKR